MWWLGLALVGAVAGSIHDNSIGGPVRVLPPEDTSSFNYNALSPFYYSAGTQHFVSPPFPEIDSRGFHGGMFDGIGDYYSSWPSTNFYKMTNFPIRHCGRQNSCGDCSLRKCDFTLGPGDEAAHTPVRSAGHLSNQRQNGSLRKKRSPQRSDNEADVKCNNENQKAEKRGRGRSGRIVRGMEIGSSGFHDDIFNSGFGDFSTMKRSREMEQKNTKAPRGASTDDQETRKAQNSKRRPEMDASGFYGDTFVSDFGDFETMEKRRPEMDAMGFHSDTFSRGFGDFETMKKRRPEMDAMGFHGDVFGGGFGEFDTMKKRRPEMDAMGFHGDVFGGGFGEFDTMKKRRPEMDAMGFHGDVFGGGFGEFDTMKKRRPEMDAMGFHGDIFGGGFGEFDTMKKRRPEMDAMGFHGDVFGGGFGEFDTMKKRRPEMDAMGFHGDVFGGGFGEFDTMKKRRPEMDAMGFHGDVFGGGFGDFETMKKGLGRRQPMSNATGRHSNDLQPQALQRSPTSSRPLVSHQLVDFIKRWVEANVRSSRLKSLQDTNYFDNLQNDSSRKSSAKGF